MTKRSLILKPLDLKEKLPISATFKRMFSIEEKTKLHQPRYI